MMKYRLKLAFRWLCAAFFAGTGVTHFTDPGPFLSIVPPYLPFPLALVYISGFFEIAGGVGILVPRTRRLAGWGLVALLVAVYPANIHMLVNEVYMEGMPQSKTLLWVRMPFQLIFAAWVMWVTDIWPWKKAPTEEAS